MKPTPPPEHNTSVERSNPVADIIYTYITLFQGEPDFILLSERNKSFTIGSTSFPDPQARCKNHPLHKTFCMKG